LFGLTVCIGALLKKLRSFRDMRVTGQAPKAELVSPGVCGSSDGPGCLLVLRLSGRSVQYRQQANEQIMETQNRQNRKEPSLLNVLGSVLASMFGVQSNRTREQDFTHGKPSQYIIIGLLVTVVFVLTIWGVVKLVMKLAGV